VSPNTPYGALVDKKGILWGASLTTNLLKLDTKTNTKLNVYDHSTYGVNYGIAMGYDVDDIYTSLSGKSDWNIHILNSIPQQAHSSIPAGIKFPELRDSNRFNGQHISF